MLLPSEFAQFTPELEDLGKHLDVRRQGDPLSALHKLNAQLYEYFDYKPKSTKADSPIEVALSTKAGVCQDFSHIMISLVRSQLEIPCRYVSGYLYHGDAHKIAPRAPRRTRGSRPFCPNWGGSASIRPTTSSPATGTFAPPSAATTPTSRRPTASFADAPRASLRGRARGTERRHAASLDRELPVPEDWSMLVEKAQALPEQPPPMSRQLQQAQQQQSEPTETSRAVSPRELDAYRFSFLKMRSGMARITAMMTSQMPGT